MFFIFSYKCTRKPVIKNKSVCLLRLLDCFSHFRIGFKSFCLRFDSEVALKIKKTVIYLHRNTHTFTLRQIHIYFIFIYIYEVVGNGSHIFLSAGLGLRALIKVWQCDTLLIIQTAWRGLFCLQRWILTVNVQ